MEDDGGAGIHVHLVRVGPGIAYQYSVFGENSFRLAFWKEFLRREDSLNALLNTTAACYRKPRILAVGLGNLLLRDDGVGVHAVRRFQQITPCPCLAVEVGTSVLSAVRLLETADRILAFDAVESGGEPGAVYVFRLGDVLKAERHDSLHAMEFIQVLRTLQHPPEEVVIIGVESGARDWGTELSPVLHAAIPNMITMAQNVIQYFNYLEIPTTPRFDSLPLTPDRAFAGARF